MVVVGPGATERTFLQAVNKIIPKIGESQIATLLNPTKRILQAMDAVQEAQRDIFYHKNWPWRRGFFEIELVTNQMWYDAPGDYHKLASAISRNSTENPIGYIDYENMLAKWPNIRSFPPGSGVGGASSVFQLANQTENFGTPTVVTHMNGYFGFMLIPDSEFVELEGLLYGTYWKQAGTLGYDYDYLDLPPDLWHAHQKISQAILKQTMEFGDWEADRLIGERDLKRQANEGREPQDNNVLHIPDINYNE